MSPNKHSAGYMTEFNANDIKLKQNNHFLTHNRTKLSKLLLVNKRLI